MSDVAIRVENLGKLYRIGRRERYGTLRDVLRESAIAPVRKLASAVRHPRSSVAGPRSEDSIWAIKDVSFEIKGAEVVGIIGRNGAGKSTMLKILSRVTEPTQGRAEIHGRVGSLLDVGTGFHPELTGRENIYLNGAILGMKKAEIQRRFHEIVDFAEIEKHIDTPVKRYSSGMYVRLAFAVAAHLEHDILLVDEILAVGDYAFQRKCLGKMGHVAKEGRTVLLVTHSMETVRRICPRALLFHGGELVTDGPARDVIRTHMHSVATAQVERTWHNPEDAPGDDVARLKSVRVLDESGSVARSIDITRPFSLEVEYWNLQEHHSVPVIVHLWNEEGVHLFGSSNFDREPRPQGVVRCLCRVPGNLLAEGRISVNAALGTFTPTLSYHAVEYDVVSFEIVDNTTGEGARGPFTGRWPGIVRPLLQWEVITE